MKALFASLAIALSLFATTSCSTLDANGWAITGFSTPAGLVMRNPDGTYTVKPNIPKQTEVGDNQVIQNPDGTITIIPKGVVVPKAAEVPVVTPAK